MIYLSFKVDKRSSVELRKCKIRFGKLFDDANPEVEHFGRVGVTHQASRSCVACVVERTTVELVLGLGLGQDLPVLCCFTRITACLNFPGRRRSSALTISCFSTPVMALGL